TEKSGLYYYDFTKRELVFVNDADQIFTIRAAGENDLAVATNEGVLLLDANEPKQQTWYTTKDGLPTNEIEDVLAVGDSLLLVASARGIHQIDRNWPSPRSLPKKALIISKVEADSTSWKPVALEDLPYTTQQVRIHFSLRAYASNQEITYRTKLGPLETEWVESSERQRRYPGLSPGKYTFYLQAIDRFGQVVEHDPLEIYIQPAFWQTLWFKLLLALAFVSLLIGIAIWRIRRSEHQLIQEKALHQRLAKLELDALKSQMNPHFIFNALGSIQYYIQTHETDLADEYLTQFASLMRKYLDSSRDTFIPLKQELALLENYTSLEKMRFEQLFRVRIVCDSNIDTRDHYLPTMLIQPFLENAINHGLSERRDGKGLLRVRFISPRAQILICIIEDNGIGRAKAQANKRSGHRSSGMKIVSEKVETLLAAQLADININITNADPTDKTYPGTRVQITIKTLSDDEA
ncbi:MAG: histidine kinase, partial [Bacteroidota bacterium]